jgi:hypothetical protein
MQTSQDKVLINLAAMYKQEEHIYKQIRNYSLDQASILRSAGGITQIQSLLMKKRSLLDEIARLEISNSEGRLLWERNKTSFTDQIAVDIRKYMKRVSSLLEEILNLEASNDQLLLEITMDLAI